MLSPPHVIAALEKHRSAFHRLQSQAGEQVGALRRALEGLATRSCDQVDDALAHIPHPGARPTVERIAGAPVVRRFPHSWDNHAQARAWARQVLADVTTLAVDGSQIAPSTDYSIPIGAVQVGWFENPHRAGVRYTKNVDFEVVVPEELAAEADADGFPDVEVNVRRFERECDILVQYMRERSAHSPPPVCMFDGSFAVSFAAHMRPELAIRYVRAVHAVLTTSEETRVPVVGYVDSSQARDLAYMLHWLAPGSPRPAVGDGALLRGLMRWGDRSEALVCARDDHLFDRLDPDLNYYPRVHFLYLCAALSDSPARLDLPAWLLEAGELERVIDVIRAECVVGNGYPYALQTADAVAVLSAADRERFYRIVQEFVEGMDIDLRYRRKAYSKRQRR